MESYAHKAAKAVVLSWLENPRVGDVYDSALGFSWFGESLSHPFWEEYPIMNDGTGLDPLWGLHYETRDTWPNGGVKAWSLEGNIKIPDYDSLQQAGTPPRAILDIAIADMCSISTGIEIVHKNPPSNQKLIFLKKIGLPSLLVLPSRWVLGQVAPPKEVPQEFWIWQ